MLCVNVFSFDRGSTWIHTSTCKSFQIKPSFLGTLPASSHLTATLWRKSSKLNSSSLGGESFPFSKSVGGCGFCMSSLTLAFVNSRFNSLYSPIAATNANVSVLLKIQVYYIQFTLTWPAFGSPNVPQWPARSTAVFSEEDVSYDLR